MTAKSPAPTSAAPPALAREPEIWAYDGDGYQITEAARPHMRVAFLPSNATAKRRRELGRLIAAAPELLEALRMFEARVLRHGSWDDGCFYYGATSASELQEPLALARSAIAKAEGRT